MAENGEVLEQTKGKIDEALKNKRLGSTERLQLEVLQLLVLFLANDHPRVMSMWRTYKLGLWGIGIVAATLLTLLASGKMMVTIR